MNNKERPGRTTISSVSLSKEFQKLCEDYNISPSQAIIKGIAVELLEKGVSKYCTELNYKRARGIKAFLESHNELDSMQRNAQIKFSKVENQLDEIAGAIQLLKQSLNKYKKEV